MDDSADIETATAALNHAVDSLEDGVGQLLSRMRTLEAGANDSDAFREDRTKLAAQLDEMAANAQAATEKLATREAEFADLARESEAELDRVMSVVRDALSQ